MDYILPKAGPDTRRRQSNERIFITLMPDFHAGAHGPRSRENTYEPDSRDLRAERSNPVMALVFIRLAAQRVLNNGPAPHELNISTWSTSRGRHCRRY